MRDSRFRFLRGALCAAAISWGATAARAVTIDYVPVGNPGNPANPGAPFQNYGSVATPYLIGRTEVTNAQYTEFLNAKAAADPLELYHPLMASEALGGIIRSGTSGSYTYAVKEGRGKNPVVYVSWYDSIRFANWLNNGQGAGDTETGAYTLLGGTATPANGNSITRNEGAQVFLPSENEWFKAAYYQPSDQGGPAGNYWKYPTGTDDRPFSAKPPGDPAIASNAANFYFLDGDASNGFNDGYAATGSPVFDHFLNYLTDADAYAAATSFYGTLGQTGNVREWHESLYGTTRGLRGGSWNNDIVFSDPSFSVAQGAWNPSDSGNWLGFRVAAVPEPSTGVLAIIAGAWLGRLRRRKVTL